MKTKSLTKQLKEIPVGSSKSFSLNKYKRSSISNFLARFKEEEGHQYRVKKTKERELTVFRVS